MNDRIKEMIEEIETMKRKLGEEIEEEEAYCITPLK